MVIYGLKISAEAAIAGWGERLGLEMWQASMDSVDLVERIVGEDRIACEFERTGSVELGFNQRDLARFRAESAWVQDRLGFATEVYGPDRIREVVGSDRFVAGLAESFSAGVQPAKFALGLAASVAAGGGVLIESTPVTDIERSGAGFSVHTPRGNIRAGEVLLATNGYTNGLQAQLQRRIVPIGSYIVVTEPLPEETARRLVPERRMLWTSRRFLNYFRLTADNRLMVGGRQNLSPDLDLQQSARLLRRTIEGFYPELAGVGITHTWTGRLGVTFDLLPHIGRFDGVWHALGFGGHGMGIGTYLGHEVAGLMTGEIGRSPFAEIPFPTKWFYRKWAWFLRPAAVLYRFLDRIGR
jgi:glycine/D-amino acid oxidase-like deaminating enzyme